MKLHEVKQKRRPISDYRNGRFLTQLDMAIIKHDEAVVNSRINRGELKSNDLKKDAIYICGCGAPGCAIHSRHVK